MQIAMKQFVKKCILFCLLFISSYILFFLINRGIVGNQYEGSFSAAMLDKYDRMQSIRQPKIILVGNSNVSFGFDSEMIEQAFDMPVVNMGYNGNLGNENCERTVLFGINKGDIVIVCDDSYTGSYILDPVSAWRAIEYHTKLWRVISKDQYIRMAEAYPYYAVVAAFYKLKGSPYNKIDNTTVYSRGAYNLYGDVVDRMPTKLDKSTFQNVGIPTIYQDGAEWLRNLNEYVQNSGATLLIAGYPIGDGEYRTWSDEELDNFKEQIESSTGCDVISDYKDYLFPYSYFYNQFLHLSKKGAKARTEQLIRDLGRWLDEKDK